MVADVGNVAIELDFSGRPRRDMLVTEYPSAVALRQMV